MMHWFLPYHPRLDADLVQPVDRDWRILLILLTLIARRQAWADLVADSLETERFPDCILFAAFVGRHCTDNCHARPSRPVFGSLLCWFSCFRYRVPVHHAGYHWCCPACGLIWARAAQLWQLLFGIWLLAYPDFQHVQVHFCFDGKRGSQQLQLLQ